MFDEDRDLAESEIHGVHQKAFRLVTGEGGLLDSGMKTSAILLMVTLSFTAALAVEPPPDGGYANQNTAEGEDALFTLTSGFNNTALGFKALYHNTDGLGNTATGYQALFNNLESGSNTATGFLALFNNTSGIANTASGADALYSNTTGELNTADGESALYSNTTGSNNVALGDALYANTTGSNNAATGSNALEANTTGSYNTASGSATLIGNTSGSTNTAIGYKALQNNTGGNNNIAIGASAGFYVTSGNNNIDLSALGATGESNTMRLGKYGVQKTTFIAGISGATVPNGVSVIVDSVGHVGTINSSARYKEHIQPMAKSSEAILALKPVTFRYKKDLDPDAIPQFGLVAEEVAKIDSDLVARDEQGKPYTVRYEAVNAMLLNEFLKAHQRLEKQDATIGDLKAALTRQQEQIAALASQVKAVSSAPRGE
jgi:hypothetical protein